MGFRFRFRHRIRTRGRGRRHGGHISERYPGSIPLNLVPPGSVVRVYGLEGRGRIGRRLSEMGFIPGTEVRVIRRAPLADPIEYQLRGYLVSLRREEAAMVFVQIVEKFPISDNESDVP